MFMNVVSWVLCGIGAVMGLLAMFMPDQEFKTRIVGCVIFGFVCFAVGADMKKKR